MAIAVWSAPATMTAEQYHRITERFDAAGTGPPPGRRFHACFGQGDHLMVFDVWDSLEELDAFTAALMPILAAEHIQMAPPEPLDIHYLVDDESGTLRTTIAEAADKAFFIRPVEKLREKLHSVKREALGDPGHRRSAHRRAMTRRAEHRSAPTTWASQPRWCRNATCNDRLDREGVPAHGQGWRPDPTVIDEGARPRRCCHGGDRLAPPGALAVGGRDNGGPCAGHAHRARGERRREGRRPARRRPPARRQPRRRRPPPARRRHPTRTAPEGARRPNDHRADQRSTDIGQMADVRVVAAVQSVLHERDCGGEGAHAVVLG